MAKQELKNANSRNFPLILLQYITENPLLQPIFHTFHQNVLVQIYTNWNRFHCSIIQFFLIHPFSTCSDAFFH